MSKKLAAEMAADWWTERLGKGNKEMFRAALITLIRKEFKTRDIVILNCDYDPLGILLDAVHAAGVECTGKFFSARGILPQKYGLAVYPDKLVPKEGYGNWTDEIPVKEN